MSLNLLKSIGILHIWYITVSQLFELDLNLSNYSPETIVDEHRPPARQPDITKAKDEFNFVATLLKIE